MRNLRRNKRKLYLCQKYHDERGINKYREPMLIYENYWPTNSEGDLISFGMNYPMYLRLKPSINERDLFHEGDRFYIYTTPPEEHDELCKNADYEIYKKPMIHIDSMEIMLYRRSGDRHEQENWSNPR